MGDAGTPGHGDTAIQPSCSPRRPAPLSPSSPSVPLVPRRALFAPALAAGLLACGRQPAARPSGKLLPTATPGVPQPTPLATIWAAPSTSGSRRPRDFLTLPLRLVVPRLEIDGPIVAVGLTEDGAMDVPQRAGDVGWYQLGPRPGSRGNAVLAGHVDWRGEVGIFGRLRELRPGDSVIIRGADGESRAYATQWLEEYPVESAPIQRVFESMEEAALTLITCGGRWNPLARRYDTRVVARAIRTA